MTKVCLIQRFTFPIITFTVIILLLMVLPANAAYIVTRPVDNAWYINQAYLYGENGGVHKSIDFPANYDTNVYAAANGTVVNLRENLPDNDHSWPWGNFVLVQHDQRHSDRIHSTTNAYVYSLYLHLKFQGVLVEDGQRVTAGMLIGKVDNTGNSDGNHLHFQIVIHPQSDRDLYPNNTLDSENRTRNPELWLTPYTNTGIVVGKVTNTSGNPVPGLQVYGLIKEHGWGEYEYSETYVGAPINPDDVLVENWATTDVTPGTYHITLSNGYDWGWHTVRGGRITYIGLYPVWLPDVRGSWNGWSSRIIMRNDDGAYINQVNTTYFNTDGTVKAQRTDFIDPGATLILTPPSNFRGSAIVVPSEITSVIVNRYIANPYASAAYVGINTAEPTVYLPLVHRNNGGWYSDIIIMNTGNSISTVTVYFQTSAGEICPQSFSINSNGSYIMSLANIGCLGSSFVGGARIVSNNGQPLAAVTTQRKDFTNDGIDDTLMENEGVTTPYNANFLPLLMRGNAGWDSGIMLQNPNPVNNEGSTDYYNLAPGGYCCNGYRIIGPNSVFAVFPLPPSAPFVGSGFDYSTNGLTNYGIVNQIRGSGNYNAMSYNAQGSGSQSVSVPLILKNYNGWLGRNGWNTGLNVQNIGTSPANVTVDLYSSVGDWVTTIWLNAIAVYSSGNIFPIPNVADGFKGSAWITSNQPIVVAVNHISNLDNTEDTSMSHGGVNR